MATYTAAAGGGKYTGTTSADQFNGQGGADSFYAGAGDDLVYGGGGNDLLYGQDGNDTLDGNAGSDLIDAGAGADVLVYRLAENAGCTDVYSGALGLDTLRLEFTAAQWASAVVQSEVARYAAHLASVARLSTGEVANGVGRDFNFDFGGGTRLSVSMVETLQVVVDGRLVEVGAPRITGHTDAAVGEDEGASAQLSAQGTVGFSDVDLLQSHTVSVSAVAGNALGGSVTGVVADTATGDGQGQVAWSYSLDRAVAQRLAADQVVVERFNVTVTDSSGKSATQEVSVSVTGANDAPVLGSAQAVLAAGSEDTAYTVTQAQLLQGFSDVDGDALSATGLTADHGTAVLNADGSWTVTPAANYNGALTLSYAVSDGAASTRATLGLTLVPVADAPALTGPQPRLTVGNVNVSYTVTKAQLLQGFTDADGDVLSPVNLACDHGMVTQNANGTWTITPPANYAGPIALSYGVSDGTFATPAKLVLTLAEVSPVELSAIAAGSGGFVINGQSTNDWSGHSLANAGDVNGDGLGDLIVGAHMDERYGSSFVGRSYVVFGRSGSAAVELSAVAAGDGGFVINGRCAGDYSGYSVSGAGDVNGDGLMDLLVGAPRESGSSLAMGRSYVVFGRSGGKAAVNLSALSSEGGGLVINGVGAQQWETSGVSVSGAGDVNGDGLADLLVGAYGTDAGGRRDAGCSYVVFGRSVAGVIDLSAVAAGNGGFVVNGLGATDLSGWSVSGAGDVNGDGLSDLIIGAYGGDPGGRVDAGCSYVVFGRSAAQPALELSAIAAGSGGFVINGVCVNDWSGYSVSGAGDVNGDGLADLIVGGNAGRSYVVFGRSAAQAAVELSAVAAGVGGFVINGQCAGDWSSRSVSGAGDVNGDGLADLIVGAYGSDPAAGRADAGRSYVVFGRSGAVAVELSAVAQGRGGFAVNGQCTADYSGYSVSAAGDVNGDGLADLIVGAFGGDPAAERTDAGRSYVIFGATGLAYAQTAVDQLGGAGADSLRDAGLSQTLVAGAGDDTLTATAASVLYGGAGNDRFVIDGAMTTALQSPLGSGGNVQRLARIDGGTGLDTVALSGAGLVLDLTRIANPAATNPDGGSRIDGIEKIDLTGSGDNALALKAADVLDMAGVNGFTANGRHQLMVTGDAGDTLDLADGVGTAGWTHGTQTTIGGTAYETWTHNASLSTVFVSPAAAVI